MLQIYIKFTCSSINKLPVATAIIVMMLYSRNKSNKIFQGLLSVMLWKKGTSFNVGKRKCMMVVLVFS